MCEHDSARPALHPKQCAAKMVPSHSVITQTFTSGSFILWEWCTFPTTTCFPAIILSCTEVTNPLKCLQACMAFKLLLGVVTSFQNKSVASSIDGKHSGLNWSLGILAGSTTTNEIFCKYILLTCVSKTFAYSESTGISLERLSRSSLQFSCEISMTKSKSIARLVWTGLKFASDYAAEGLHNGGHPNYAYRVTSCENRE